MSSAEKATGRAVMTAMQREVLVWVSRGQATAAEVQIALAGRGLVRTRRGVQRTLRRMCLRGFLKAVYFHPAAGARCHYHIVLPEGRWAYAERERLFPAAADAPLLASEAECPPPDWAVRAPAATRPPQVTAARIVRFLGQYAPQLLPYLPLALSPATPPQRQAIPPMLPWPTEDTGLSSQWVVGLGMGL